MNRAILVLIFVILLAPLYFLFLGSIQDLHGFFLMPPRLIPVSVTLDNFRWAFNLPIGKWAINTSIVLSGCIVVAVVASTTAGYAFAYFDFPAKKILWVILLCGIMIPRMSIIIPQFIVVRRLGFSGTLASVIFPAAFAPIPLYLARAYFETIPRSMLESARIDGAGELTILIRIIAPLARPIVTLIALMAGIGSMSNYLWQMLQLQSPRVMTLLIGLMREAMRRGGGDFNVNNVGRSMAVAVILFIPMLIVFLSANKYFVGGLGGGVKE